MTNLNIDIATQKQEGQVHIVFGHYQIHLGITKESEKAYCFQEIGWYPKKWFKVNRTEYANSIGGTTVLENLEFQKWAWKMLDTVQRRKLENTLFDSGSLMYPPQ